jgi:hypothetical protein
MLLRVLAQPVPRRPRAAALALVLLAATTGCVQRVEVVPTIAPATLAAPPAPIDRRLVLLLTPAFSDARSVSAMGDPVERLVLTTSVGAVADTLLRDWATRSFARVDVRRMTETEALRTFVTATAADEVVVYPRFEGPQGSPGEAGEPVVAGVRFDVRVPRTGAVHSWLGTSRVDGGLLPDRAGRRSGRALVGALRGATDSLVRYRTEF